MESASPSSSSSSPEASTSASRLASSSSAQDPDLTATPSAETTLPPSRCRQARLCDYPHDDGDNRQDPSLLDSRTGDPDPPSHEIDPPPSLREPHPPDLLSPYPDDRPTLAEFRLAEGPRVRAQKLRDLWESLPELPPPSSTPTPTALAKLPGQGTLLPLSSERAERLRRLYQEELVHRVTCERPEAKLWGGADDLNEPEAGPSNSMALGYGETTTTTSTPEPTAASSAATTNRGKGIAWKDFR